MMKEIVINTDGVSMEEEYDSAIRVKALMVNENNEILLGYAFNTYQFIGGHINKDEDLFEGLIREIREETGIEIPKSEYTNPFMKIVHYSKNYRNSGKARENIIYYFDIPWNKSVNINNIEYDEWEEKGKFEVRKVKLDDLEDLLVKHISDNELNPLIVDEMLDVLKEYKYRKKYSEENVIG